MGHVIIINTNEFLTMYLTLMPVNKLWNNMFMNICQYVYMYMVWMFDTLFVL